MTRTGKRGKLDKFDEARIGGMQYAINLVKTKGIEEAEKEVKFRCSYNIPVGLKQDELDSFSTDVKHQMFDTMKVVASMSLRDTFGFGASRLKRFWQSFEELCESTIKDYATFQDFIDTINHECNADMGEIRVCGKDTKVG